ncbi:Mitochondrial distribution and morphology protein 31, mitochondrial precursor [Balamuthia mandrillaris]
MLRSCGARNTERLLLRSTRTSLRPSSSLSRAPQRPPFCSFSSSSSRSNVTPPLLSKRSTAAAAATTPTRTSFLYSCFAPSSSLRRRLCDHVKPQQRLKEAAGGGGPKKKKLGEQLRTSLQESARKTSQWTSDAILAISGWMVVGTTTWVLLGTTTLVSSLLYLANTLRFQAEIAAAVSQYLTKNAGISITFETAIVPRWKEGCISLCDVRVERDEETARQVNGAVIELRIAAVDVKLSGWRWMEGKGLLKELTLKGVRGRIDRRQIEFPAQSSAPLTAEEEALRAAAETATRLSRRGGFDLSHLKLEDVFITVHNPKPSRPLPVSIHSMTCSRLRQRYLLFDILSAEHAHGCFDGCLFTLTKPHLPFERLVPASASRHAHNKGAPAVPVNPPSVRLATISGLPMDHLSKNSSGPLSWITSGFIDVGLEIILPNKDDDDDEQHKTNNPEENVIVNFNVMLRNLSADVPMKSPHLSYMSSALAQPIVFYLNTNYMELPLSFPIQLDYSRFDGGWYLGDVGFWNAVSAGAGKEIAQKVQEQRRPKNIWGITYAGVGGLFRGARYLWRYHLVPFLWPTAY